MDLNLVINIFTYSLLFSLLFSVIIIISFPLFKEHYDSAFEGILPVYNLFKLCEIVGYNGFIGFLFLIPGLNLILIYLIGIRLRNVVETYSFFKIGFVILPMLFIPLAAYIKYSKPTKENDIKKEEPEKFEEVTQEEIVSEEADEENNNDDSIFRIQRKTVNENVENKPYKAKKVIVNEEFINSAPAEQEVIEKVNKNGD